MSTEHIETVIIGAGQAGLSTGVPPEQAGRACVVLDGNARVGDNWRRQWDTLRLYTPAKYDGLPGMPFPADPWTFPQKDEVADYLESYALKFDLPVRMSTRVDALEQRTDGGFELRIGDDTITCDNVVVATGTFGQTPNIPEFADPRPDDPPAALERVPPARPPPARTGSGGRRLALRHGHRLRGRADQPGHAVRAGPRPDAVPARAASGEASSSRWSSSRGGTC